jgi:hypothetical protein
MRVNKSELTSTEVDVDELEESVLQSLQYSQGHSLHLHIPCHCEQHIHTIRSFSCGLPPINPPE